MTELGHVLRLRTRWRVLCHPRVVEIPVRDQLKMPIGRDQVVPGRHLEHAVEQCAHLVTSVFDRLCDGLRIPARRNSGRKQCLHLGSEIQGVVVEGVKQGLDPESVTSSKQRAMVVVPDNEGEFSTQLMQALRSEILVEVERYLAVRACAQPMPGSLELALDRLVAVELAVGDDLTAAVLTRNRLSAGREVNDAEPRVSEPHALVGR